MVPRQGDRGRAGTRALPGQGLGLVVVERAVEEPVTHRLVRAEDAAAGEANHLRLAQAAGLPDLGDGLLEARAEVAGALEGRGRHAVVG